MLNDQERIIDGRDAIGYAASLLREQNADKSKAQPHTRMRVHNNNIARRIPFRWLWLKPHYACNFPDSLTDSAHRLSVVA